MKTLVILAHPNIGQSVVSKALIGSLPKDIETILVHDLYQCYPDWGIDVAREQKLVEQHDRIIFQFPFYWFNMPPLLKKWMDEVLTYGWCYGPDGNKMEGKEIGIVVSTGGSASAYQYGGQNKFPMDHYLSYMDGMANTVRAKYIPAHVFHGAVAPSQEALEADFAKYLNYITK